MDERTGKKKETFEEVKYCLQGFFASLRSQIVIAQYFSR
jgi:hypothetical protein